MTHAAVAFVGAQTPPHPPQRMGSLRVSASQPFSATPSQSAKPALQVNPQRPAVQVGEALALAAQAVPHPPQCAGSVKVLASQPLRAMPSQSP
jgi:hypothetical protein